MEPALPVIYNKPKEEVFKILEKINTLVFDVDDTLISFRGKTPNLTHTSSYRIVEHNLGLSKNPEFEEVLKQYLELSKKREMCKELIDLLKKLDSFWKGKSLITASQGLYPIPFFPGVINFFDQIKKVGNYFVGLISSGPSFFISLVAKELGANYFEGTDVEVDSHGFFTGNNKSPHLFGKAESLNKLCRYHGKDITNTIYHGDREYDIDALKEAGLGIAVRPAGGIYGETAKAADVVLLDWGAHPLLEFLRLKRENKVNF